MRSLIRIFKWHLHEALKPKTSLPISIRNPHSPDKNPLESAERLMQGTYSSRAGRVQSASRLKPSMQQALRTSPNRYPEVPHPTSVLPASHRISRFWLAPNSSLVPAGRGSPRVLSSGLPILPRLPRPSAQGFERNFPPPAVSMPSSDGRHSNTTRDEPRVCPDLQWNRIKVPVFLLVEIEPFLLVLSVSQTCCHEPKLSKVPLEGAPGPRGLQWAPMHIPLPFRFGTLGESAGPPI